jgi:PKD repeat protein
VVYNDIGSYDVSLSVTNAFGNAEIARSNYITVLPAMPVADFSAEQTSGATGLSVTFANHSSHARYYQWTFEGGSPASSALENPAVVYSHPGIFDVRLKAGNDYGENEVIKEDYIQVTELSLNAESRSLLAVYPVIASGFQPLQITSGSPLLSVELCALSGKTVKRIERINALQYSLPTANFLPGIYLLHITTSMGEKTLKIEIKP